MRKILSLFIAIAMIVSLVPTFASAASEYDVAIDFGKTKGATNNMAVISLDGSDAGYQIIVDESCDTVYDQRQQPGEVQQFSINDGYWTSASSANQRKYKVTIEVPVSKAGYYNMKILGATWYPGAAFYFYVDGEYAGLYDFDSKVNKDTLKMSTEKTLNTLYLDPGEDGKVEIMFAVAVPSTYYTQARALLKTLKLDYVGETLEYADFVHNIPSEIVYGETVSFTVHAVMSDGSIFRANNYEVAEDGTAVASKRNAVYAETAEDSSITIVKTSDDVTYDGVYTGQLVAEKFGETTITLTAMIDGEPKTKEVKVNVVEPEEAIPVILDLTAKCLIYGDKTVPSADWKTIGFNIVFDKTTSYASRYMSGYNHIYMRNGSYSVWPNQGTKELMFTVEKVVPKPGNYDVYMQGYVWYAGS
ncbi:MAG: hypothetical protein IJO09_02825, partial [Oscillospiraceae bacterium]|nr:hypothetical protein [Oscillospiraceae bacterium]